MLGVIRRLLRRNRHDPYSRYINELGVTPTLDEAKRMRFEPGMIVPVSGQYTRSDGDQVTCTKGHRFPPGRAGHRDTFRLTDYTR